MLEVFREQYFTTTLQYLSPAMTFGWIHYNVGRSVYVSVN
jgi:hypothetical protein